MMRGFTAEEHSLTEVDDFLTISFNLKTSILAYNLCVKKFGKLASENPDPSTTQESLLLAMREALEGMDSEIRGMRNCLANMFDPDPWRCKVVSDKNRAAKSRKRFESIYQRFERFHCEFGSDGEAGGAGK